MQKLYIDTDLLKKQGVETADTVSIPYDCSEFLKQFLETPRIDAKDQFQKSFLEIFQDFKQLDKVILHSKNSKTTKLLYDKVENKLFLYQSKNYTEDLIFLKNGFEDNISFTKLSSFSTHSFRKKYGISDIDQVYETEMFLRFSNSVFVYFLTKGLIIKHLKDRVEYQELLKPNILFAFKDSKTQIECNEYYVVQQMDKDQKASKDILKIYKELDYERIRLPKYEDSMFRDINKGSWEVFKNLKETENTEAIELDEELIAKDPKDDIRANGIVGIDFGTKNTVIVYQDSNNIIKPIRIGEADQYSSVKSKDFENPTIMKIVNFASFLNDFEKTEFRPYTKWDDLSISHQAFSDMAEAQSEHFNAYLMELKKWASSSDQVLKIQDYQKEIYKFGTFLNIKDGDIDPIMIYAYYLGLMINNQIYGGIFTKYYLSFPVTFENAIKDKIINSFKKGIKKSMPIDGIDIEMNIGVSEPAAYAVVALEHYDLLDEDEEDEDQKVYYGIFDFGGGTTDFDFGLYRFADIDNRDEENYDYVIEHKGNGGDRYLGGENLLENLAYIIFADNSSILKEERIPFLKPADITSGYTGFEILLDNSREARLNTIQLIQKIRHFWERDKDSNFDEKIFEEDEINLNFYDRDSKYKSIKLKIDEEKLKDKIIQKITNGIELFFYTFKNTFEDDIENIDLLHIFLAGNSSKSSLVKKIFDEKIEAFKHEFENIECKLYDPIDNQDDYEKPNGKTGVAFGLLKSRKGGNIMVINHQIDEEADDIGFQYFLGRQRRKKFSLINKDNQYNEWIRWSSVVKDTDVFEVYYTQNPSAKHKNKLSIEDNSVKMKILTLKNIDINSEEEQDIYIKLVGPHIFAYGIGDIEGDEIKEIDKVNLNGE
jgi:hypothetical protein